MYTFEVTTSSAKTIKCPNCGWPNNLAYYMFSGQNYGSITQECVFCDSELFVELPLERIGQIQTREKYTKEAITSIDNLVKAKENLTSELLESIERLRSKIDVLEDDIKELIYEKKELEDTYIKCREASREIGSRIKVNLKNQLV